MSETSTTTIPAGTWTLDTAHSSVGFTVRHMMVSKVRGRFTDYTADIVTAEDPLQSTVNATIQMASIDTGDEGRDGHLRTNDFFDIEEFPTMTFTSTGITGSGGDFELAGDLTIKGVTKPVTFDLEFGGVGKDPWGNTPRRVHGDGHDQPQGLRHGVQRGARDRRDHGRREGEHRARHRSHAPGLMTR